MRNHYLILVVALSLLPFTPAGAAPADLPETGQTSCSDAAGAPVNCAGTGQDGDLKARVAWPNPRFTVGSGATSACVTDNLTGLMWMGAPSATADTWANALTTANDLVLCGFDDWRLPNINELESLVNSEAADQATFLNAQGFAGVQAGNYWSSSTHARFPIAAWFVEMVSGLADAANKTAFSYYVWPVRTGQ